MATDKFSNPDQEVNWFFYEEKKSGGVDYVRNWCH